MRICYIDEAGDGRRPDPSKPDLPPVFAICGLVVEGGSVADLTTRFLQVKGRYHPGKAGQRPLDGILNEVKGSEIRRDIRSGSRRRTRAALGFLDQITKLLGSFDVGIIGRVWIKDRTTDSDERSMYTFSIQNIVEHFQHDLETTSASGLVICDSRSNSLNENVAHSVFTKMFKQSGNALPQHG